jgi:hypothetical protein
VDLLLSVFLGVSFPRLLGMVARVVGVPPGGVCVVRGLLVLSALMMFSRFPVMVRGLRMTF